MTKSQFEGKEHCNHLGKTLGDFPLANAAGSSILFFNKIVVNKQLSRAVNKENSHPISHFAIFGQPLHKSNKC